MIGTERPAVGFIGLGDQGLPMAVAIAEAGYELHVWARRPQTLDALGRTPFVRHDAPESLAAAADILGICVPTDDDVRALVEDRLREHVRPGTVVVNHGTGTPANARTMAHLCAERGVGFLDAPVSGSRAGAEARTLLTMVGGAEADYERCRPVFTSFSAHVARLGGHGAGQFAKLCNNALLMMNRANAAAVLDLAATAGTDPAPLAAALLYGSGASAALRLIPAGDPQALAARTAHLTSVELLDMDIFATTMTELGIDARFVTDWAISGARDLHRLTVALNH